MTLPSVPRTKSSPNERRLSLNDILTKGKDLPSRIILHGTEGIGKTSFAAQAPKPIFLMARGETGLETLIDSGRLQDTPHLPEIETWSELLGAVEMLTVEEHPYKTVVIDTVNGCERLCHEYVCKMQFNNDWSDKGFQGYMRGYDVALADWRTLLIALDRLRETKRMGVFCLCHTKVTNFNNPEGPNYDRYSPDMHAKTWGLTHKWSDMVLFAHFETFVNKESRAERAKGKGGTSRVVYTERSAAWDAKNRYGLPTEIPMGDSPKVAWSNLQSAVQKAKAGV